MKDELLKSRNFVIFSKNMFTFMNDFYNKLLITKHGRDIEESNCKEKDAIIENISGAMTILFTFGAGMALMRLFDNFFVFLACLPFIILGNALIEFHVLPKILYGSNFQHAKIRKRNQVSVKDLDEVYEDLDILRDEYHKAYKEYEAMLDDTLLTDAALYQEYLDLVKDYSDLMECEMSKNNNQQKLTYKQ